MAKTLYLVNAVSSVHRGNNDTKLNGTAAFWVAKMLSEVHGPTTGTTVTATVTTVAGATNGIEVGNATPIPYEWISEPLSADFTISGTITLNLWAAESSNSANAAVNAVIERFDAKAGVLTQIAKTARVTEAPLTTPTAANFTVTPTSTVCNRGDRLRVRVFADDAGTMGAGFTFTLWYDRSTAAQGESFVTFTENLTFEPAGDPPIYSNSQSDNSNVAAIGMTAPNNVQMAVSFFSIGSLPSLTIYPYAGGVPTDNFIVEIQTNSGGVPSGTVVATVATIPAASLPQNQGGRVALVLTGPWSLTANTTYWLVMRRSGTLSNTQIFGTGTSTLAVSGWTALIHNGTSWVANTAIPTMSLGYTYTPPTTYYLTDTAEIGVVGFFEQLVTGIARSVGATASATAFGQSFTAGGTLTELMVILQKNGAPTDNAIVEIQSDSSGSPSGTVIGTVATVAGSTLTTSPVQYIWSTSIVLTAGTIYWIVLRRSGALDGTNFYTCYGGPATSLGVQKTFNGTVWATAAIGTLACRITPANVATKKALATRGSGSVNAVTNTAAGPVPSIQVTATGGGTLVEWYTPPLNAITLGGKAKFNIRALESGATINGSVMAEIAITAGNGTGATVWGIADVEAVTTNGSVGELPTTDGAVFAWVSGDDTSVTLGQRLRFRIYVDDCGDVPLVTGGTATVSYNGTSAAAAGDTYVILPVAVTEQPTGALKTSTIRVGNPGVAVMRSAIR